MEWPEFCGPAYRLETPNAACDRVVNMVLEQIERGPRRGKMRYRGIPGLRDFKQVGPGPIRGMWSAEGGAFEDPDRMFVVSGPNLYEVFEDGTPSQLRGNVGNDAHPVDIVANGFQLAIASAGNAYIDPGGPFPVVPLVDTLGAPIAASSIAFQDQYFIASIKNTKQIMVSNLAPAGGTWNPENVAIKEAYADNIQRIWVDKPGGLYLWVFGSDTTEVWQNTAGPFPFSRIQGMVFPIGCDSPWSVAGVAGIRYWYWEGQVWAATGFQPERISDYGVEVAINSYSSFDKHNCEGWAWLDGGHSYYALTFGDHTWVYDRATGAWHERALWRPDLGPGVYSRYVPRMGVSAWDRMIVGDYRSNQLYEMSHNTYTDAGGALLKRQRIAPWLTNEMYNTRVNRFTLDADTGIGLDVAEGTLGYDPRSFMRYSIDRGKTWSNELQQTMGKIGETETRVFWPNLGSCRIGLAVDWSMTDPVPTNINGAFIDISPGSQPPARGRV